MATRCFADHHVRRLERLRGIARYAGLLVLLTFAVPASAADTTTYKYDALGRLVQSNVAGGANDGLANQISYDAAGNRSNYQTTGARPRVRKVIVLPLNGYTIIPLP